MNVKLLKLIITNFKGIKSLVIDFKQQTEIYGANEAGKTSVVDAFTWLFFGKDSQDRKDFNIKNTLKTDFNKQDHSVEAVIEVDGTHNSLKRIFREKWQKKRGEKIPEFTGHEQDFLWNEVPMNATEFQNKVSSIIDETVFKLVTNPLYFNSLNWTKRRDFLYKLAGNITDDQIAAGNPEFIKLLKALNGQDIEDYKKVIAGKKKPIKDTLEQIPTRIDETLRRIPEEKDFSTIEVSINQYSQQITEIDAQINDKSTSYNKQNEAIQARQREIFNLKNKLSAIESEVKSQIQTNQNNIANKRKEIQENISRIEADIKSKSSLLESRKKAKEDLALRTENLRSLFNATNSKELVFGDNEFCCPACNREFEATDIEAKKAEMRKRFNTDKTLSLNEINRKGAELVSETKECDDMISTLETTITSLNSDLVKAKDLLEDFEVNTSGSDVLANNRFEVVIKEHQEHISLSASIKELESIPNEVKDLDVSDLRNQKNEITQNIDALKKQLNDREVIKTNRERISQLENDQSNLSQQLADLENIEFVIDDFNKSKIDIVEARINGLFRFVTFKMFSKNINGGLEETCQTVYKGVPFSDLNTAGKAWAGIDIINTLSKHYSFNAPIFLDNRESVTNIPETESQVISFIVSPTDKSLRVA
ncbi:AAA family ATPase [Pedobacter panaciterrae]